MAEKIKSKKYKGVYYIKKGSNSRDWVYYCKFRWRNKLYNFRNLTAEFSVSSENEASKKITVLQEEAKKALELGLPNPLEIKKRRKEEKALKEKDKSIRTLNEHWEIIIEDVKKKKSEHTYDQYNNFWNKYIKDSIGDKFPSDIKTTDLDKILYKTTLKDQSDRYKQLLVRLLRMVYIKPLIDKEVETNPAEAYKFDLDAEPEKPMISERTDLTHLEISKMLYKEIPNYISQFVNQREEWQMLLYLCLMTGRRYGEVFKLTSKNIKLDEQKIEVEKKQTKGKKKKSWFPIPDECMEFMARVQEGEPIFKHISYGSYYMVFQRLKERALTREFRELHPEYDFEKLNRTVKLNKKITAKELKLLEEYNNINFDLTAHDVRSLFISILVNLGEDSKLIDMMLDHEQNFDEIWRYYLDFSDKSKLTAWQKYWEVLRD